MASANLISYSNFPKLYTSDLLLDETNVRSSSEYSAYVSSPSWHAQVKINKDNRTLVQFTVYAAYWNGSTWVDAWNKPVMLQLFSTGEYDEHYYHNSTLGSTSNDVADAVLWEIHLVYVAPNNRIRLWVDTGSIGCMPEDTYNNLYKGRPIYSCGGPASSSVYGVAGKKSRDTALSLFSQSAARGTPITALDVRKPVAYKYN